MQKSMNRKILNRVFIYEYTGFIILLLFIWLNEIVDIPHLCFGAPVTVINWQESLFETLLILITGGFTVIQTKKMLKRLVFLEGMLQVCASCKKILTDEGTWKQMETYIRNHSDVSFSHGVCPTCAKELYPEFNPYEMNE
jgi:hypothetical protein